MEIASPEAKERLVATNYRFIDSVATMLKATRLTVFS